MFFERVRVYEFDGDAAPISGQIQGREIADGFLSAGKRFLMDGTPAPRLHKVCWRYALRIPGGSNKSFPRCILDMVS